MSKAIGGLHVVLGVNTTQFASGLNKAQASMTKMGKSMRATGSKMTTNISMPLALIGGAAIKSAMDFQTSMRKINTQVGLTTERINGMAKGVMNLSNETGVASTELGDALFVITSAGMRGAESMEILDRSAKAAALGLGDAKDIARATTAIMTAYGKENISAGQATDQFMAVVREGNLVASELAPVLGRVIGVADSLGISFAEVGASVATFTRLGVRSDEAVTGLRGVMNTLLKPTAQGAKALKELGTSYSGLRKEVDQKGLAETLVSLIQKFGGNNDALASLVPNVRALSAVLGTTGKQGKEYVRIQGAIKEANGLVDLGMKQIAGDGAFQMQQALAQLQNAGIELGQMMMPIFVDIVNVVKTVAKGFINLSSGWKTGIVVGGLLMTVIGPILTVLGGIATALGAISLPLVAVVGGVALLAATILYVIENWEALKERWASTAWWKNALIDMVKLVVEYNPFSIIHKGMNELLTYLGGAEIPNPFEKMADGLETLKEELPIFEHEVKAMGDVLSDTVSKVTGAFGSFLGVGAAGGSTLPETTAPQTDNTSAIVEPPTWINLDEETAKIAKYNGEIKKTELGFDAAGEGAFKMGSATTDLGQAMQTALNTSFVAFGEALGNILSGETKGSSLLSSILSIVADFVKTLGTAAIAAGVSAVALQNSISNPYALIAAGIALVALSAVMTNVLKKGPSGGGSAQGMRSGGFVEQGGMFKLHKDEQIGLPAGSSVISKGAQRAAAGGGRGGVLTAIVTGGQLKFVLDEENRRTYNAS